MAEMIQSPVKTYTVEEFWDYMHLPENAGRRLELVNGEIVEKEESTQLTAVIGGRIAYLLNGYVLPQDVGYVTGAMAYYALSAKDFLSPDVAYISKQRHPLLNGDYFPSAPNIAIEIIRPRTKAYHLQNELHAYANNGVQSVWEVYPDSKRLTIMKYPAKSGKSLGETDILELGDILPGFTLKVSDIFPK